MTLQSNGYCFDPVLYDISRCCVMNEYDASFYSEATERTFNNMSLQCHKNLSNF